MLTAEMIHKAFIRTIFGYDVQWSDLDDMHKAFYTVLASHLNTATLDDGAAERDALRGQISQLQANINSLADTVQRVEAERDAFQQLAGAKGGSDA